MNQKTAFLISCSDHYGHRLHLFDEVLREQGYETTYITSDFDHTTKRKFTCGVPGAVQLSAAPYEKNLSFQRIRSHWAFARDVFRYLEKQEKQPDVLVVLLPPNFLGHYAAQYKKKHPDVKLIFDIFDLWPETFPSHGMKRLLALPFGVWGSLRDRALPAADRITTVCDLFRQTLKLGDRATVIPLCGEAAEMPGQPPEYTLNLCYLGAINNVVDIPRICELLGELSKHRSVKLHVLGTGERQQELMDEASAAGAHVVFHGPVYDEAQKSRIMGQCHFGLNIMKDSVCVGLTMKSVDYFRRGLPIINSIPGDTEEMVRTYGAGIQLTPGCEKEILAAMGQTDELRHNVRRLFRERLEIKKVRQLLRELLET